MLASIGVPPLYYVCFSAKKGEKDWDRCRVCNDFQVLLPDYSAIPLCSSERPGPKYQIDQLFVECYVVLQKSWLPWPWRSCVCINLLFCLYFSFQLPTERPSQQDICQMRNKHFLEPVASEGRSCKQIRWEVSWNRLNSFSNSDNIKKVSSFCSLTCSSYRFNICSC